MIGLNRHVLPAVERNASVTPITVDPSVTAVDPGGYTGVYRDEIRKIGSTVASMTITPAHPGANTVDRYRHGRPRQTRRQHGKARRNPDPY